MGKTSGNNVNKVLAKILRRFKKSLLSVDALLSHSAVTQNMIKMRG